MKRALIALAAALACAVPAVQAAGPVRPVRAFVAPLATQAPLTTAVRAGSRIVAAGDWGIVLLSDDDGRNWRQSREVPTTTMITSIVFRDDRQGWATAHGGLILVTGDGGETWKVAHKVDPDVTPMAIAFDERGTGIVVGAYGFALRSDDGGATWSRFSLEGGDIPDRHLNHVFATGAGGFAIVGEVGAVYRSADGGRTWNFQELPTLGSLWSGVALRDGSLLIGGMGGRLFRSAERGEWTLVESGTDQSIVSVGQLPAGPVVLAGVSGTVMIGGAEADGFRPVPRPDRATYAAALSGGGDRLLLFGSAGVADAELH